MNVVVMGVRLNMARKYSVLAMPRFRLQPRQRPQSVSRRRAA